MQEIVNPISEIPNIQNQIVDQFIATRKRTEDICRPLQKEDYVVQPIADVSPPKWHLAHTTWFFETFCLSEILPDYQKFDDDFSYLFNSYYETVGKRVLRTDRGNITRPGVDKIYAYRKYVDEHIVNVLTKKPIGSELVNIINLGLQHEMQHQELLLTDIKYILGHNPIFPAYDVHSEIDRIPVTETAEFIPVDQGIYEIGFEGQGFSFDNELNRHKVYLNDFEISSQPVTFGEYIEFVEDGGYKNFRFWHSDGWAWVNENKIESPMFTYVQDGKWFRYTLSGYMPIDPKDTLMHISYYEASAFAAWKKCRLPTEFEWEAASDLFKWGNCWEWTNSAYLAYPGFKTAPGAIGEYNGKFMVNQMVLRGASQATSPGHSRNTYRNFFHPHLQWQYAGIRLTR